MQTLNSQLLAEVDRAGIALISVLLIASLSVMIADDWWKRHLVRRARRKGKHVPGEWLDNRTDWRVIATLIVGLSLFLFLMANPQLTDRDFGPFDPIMKWLFARPDF